MCNIRWPAKEAEDVFKGSARSNGAKTREKDIAGTFHVRYEKQGKKMLICNLHQMAWNL